MRYEYEMENEEIPAGKILLAILSLVFILGATIAFLIGYAPSKIVYVVMAVMFISILFHFGTCTTIKDLISAVILLFVFIISSYLIISSNLLEQNQISDTELKQSVQIEATSESNIQAVDISDLDAQIAELEAQKESLAAEQKKLDRIAALEAEIAEMKKEINQ